MTIKKPYKSGGALVTDGNGNILRFTKAQVMKRVKAVQKRLGLQSHINFYNVSDCGEYWTAQAGVISKPFN